MKDSDLSWLLQVTLQLQQCRLDNALTTIDAEKNDELARIAAETWQAKASALVFSISMHRCHASSFAGAEAIVR